MLRAQGLVKTYRGPSAPIAVLAGVDFAVAPGEFAVIAGASGSGKSTLLNVLGLLEDADDGAIWFGDVAVSTLSRADRRRPAGAGAGRGRGRGGDPSRRRDRGGRRGLRPGKRTAAAAVNRHDREAL